MRTGLRVGEAVLVSGIVRDGGSLEGHPVRVRVQGHPTLTADVVTDAEGRFRHTLPGLDWGTYHLHVEALETGRHAPGTVTRTLPVRRWRPRIELTTTPITATVPASLGGRLVSEDGAPIAGAEVIVEVLDAEVTTRKVTTSASGTFTVAHTAPAGGTLTVLAGRAADARDEPAAAESVITIARAAQTLVIDAPPAATALRPLTVTGTLTDHRGGITGAGLDVRVRHGTTLLRPAVTTSAGGRWTATLTPAHHGTWTVEVSRPGDLVRAPASATRSFAVAPAPAALSMDALPTPVPWARTLTVTARMPAPSRAAVQLWARDEASGTWTRAASATTDSGGVVTFPVTARAATRYEVRFAGDATYGKAAAARVVRVSSVVEAAVSGHDRLVSGEPSFARGARPTISGRVRASRLPGSVTVTLQRWDGARWVAAQRWTAVAADGRVVTRVPKGLGAGRHRVQIAAPATPTNLAATSPWRPLRVR